METVRAKFHTSLNVSDLARSVAFYGLLLGIEPAKQRSDYAKFELDDPPLVLTLMPGRPSASGILNHFGLRVANAEVLVEIQHRLEIAGIRTKREEGVECCHARQTKFWVADPDQAFWEIYVVHEDLDEDGDDHMPAIEQCEITTGEAAPMRIVWQHHISEPVPAKIPHDDHSVHEVFFEGTANLQPSRASLAVLFAEAFRVLRPGGEVRLHGLTSDAPLTEPLPALPGPAVVVEHVPTHAEIVRALLDAGFIHIQLEKLSSTAHFTVGNVPLREILAGGRKPGHRPKTPTHSAIYLGPLAEVTDDFGNTFRRGELTALNIHDWQTLSKSAHAEEFLFP
jgi:catechol 2,3-dioxygenase-like lactoylglutathione lyase family enzyme